MIRLSRRGLLRGAIGLMGGSVAYPVKGAGVFCATIRPMFRADSPWRRPLAGRTDLTWEKVDLSLIRYSALSSWFGADAPVHYRGAADCAVHVADVQAKQVSLLYHADAWLKLSTGAWRNTGNPQPIEQEIRDGTSRDFAGFEFNPYSSADPDRLVPPSGYKRRTTPPWSLEPFVPSNAGPAANADGHMAVRQPDGSVLETFATIVLTNGDLACGFASFTDPTGMGDGSEGGRRASLIPNYAGLIRCGEMARGFIDHAIAVALAPRLLGRRFVHPAHALDRDTSDYEGSIPMGARLAIPPVVDLRTVVFATREGRSIAAAAQIFGAIVVDRAGGRSLIFCSETGARDVPDWNAELADDLRKIRDLLWLVS